MGKDIQMNDPWIAHFGGWLREMMHADAVWVW